MGNNRASIQMSSPVTTNGKCQKAHSTPRIRLARSAEYRNCSGSPGYAPSATTRGIWCCFGLAQLLLYHRQDDDPFLRHGSSSKPDRYERCLDSPMNDVLNHDTLSSTHYFLWSGAKR